jgi:hypothetical protein
VVSVLQGRSIYIALYWTLSIQWFFVALTMFLPGTSDGDYITGLNAFEYTSNMYIFVLSKEKISSCPAHFLMESTYGLLTLI